MMSTQSRTGSDFMASGCAIAICGAPFLACLGLGLALLCAEWLFPGFERSRARDWVETPCTLVSCEELVVPGAETSGSRPANVTIEATYEYEWEGKTYCSSRVDFITDFAGGDLALGELEEESIRYVKSHPAGTRTVCYVNPAEPSEAVLLPERGSARTAAILPGFLIVVGLIGLVVIINWSRIARRRREADPQVRAQTALDQALRIADRSRGSKDELRHAIGLFTEALAMNPELVGAFLGRARAAARLGEYERAVADCSEALRVSPDLAAAWCQRGEVRQDRGDCEAALADFDRAIELEPEESLHHMARGSLLKELERWDQALLSFDRAVVLDPEYAAAHFDRAECLANLGRYDEAVESYTAGLQIDPDSSFQLNHRGECHLKAGRPEEAIADFTAAIKLNPYPTFYRNRAAAYRKVGQFHKAVADEVVADEMENS